MTLKNLLLRLQFRNSVRPSTMQNTEKLCLQWNDFKDSVNSAFGKLRDDTDFSDVTLACEDGKQVEAHKVVLVSSSPFFMELLRKNKHPHPLVYMKGVKYDDLAAIVDFLYVGEANVFQENLDSFLSVAGELKLKGLSGDQTTEEARVENKEQWTRRQTKKPTSHENQTIPFPPKEYQPEFEHKNIVAVTNTAAVSVELENLDEQINSMIELTDKGKIVICKVCGNEGQRAFVVRHIEAKHITGVAHTCDICGKTARSRNALQTHKYIHHK